MMLGRTYMILALCLVAGMSLGTGLPRAAAQIVLQEDWENGLSGWDGPSFPDRMFIASDVVRSGSHSLKSVYPPGVDVSSGTAKKWFGAGYDELYVRWYQYLAPNWVWHSTATKLSILNPNPSPLGGRGPNFYIDVMWGNGQPMIAMQYMADQNYDSVNFYQNVGSPQALENGQWYCLEVQAKLNTPGQSNGEFRMWIDNQLKLEYVNRALRGPDPSAPAPSTARWDFLDLATNYAGERSYETHRWHDALVVSTQRVGCLGGATPPQPPATANTDVPAPPTNLRVVSP